MEPFSPSRFVVSSSFTTELDLHRATARRYRNHLTTNQGHDMETKPTKSERKRQAMTALAKLAELYPACFAAHASGQHRPLKIGIHRDLIERGVHPGEARALQLYARRPAYKAALSAGGPRYDLDGEPCGEVTAEQITAAKLALVEIEARVKAARERKQAERIEHEKVQAEEGRKAFEAMHAARPRREAKTNAPLGLAALKAAAQARKTAQHAG
jgi:sRNA-binding protein